MIPGRIFYQSVVYKPQNTHKLKVSLILNSIFYDQIRPFQTKYLCLTSNDFLQIDIHLQDTEQLIGQVKINNAYKSMIQHQTIDIQVNPPKQSKLKSAKISLVLQPVSSFARHKLGLSNRNPISFNFTNAFTNSEKIQNLNQLQQQQQQRSYEQKFPHQISFSQRDPLMETSRTNQNKIISPKSPKKQDNSVLNLNQSGSFSQGQVLQNLALQRQKILGQLFNKFKRNNK